MNRRVLPKYCFSIAKVVVTSFTKLVHVYYPKWLGECSSLRTQRCKNNLVRRWNCKPSSFTRVTSCESYGSSLLLQADLIINITKGDNRCSLFGIHSNILGSSMLVYLCGALFATFLSRYTLTSIVPTNDQFLSCSLFPGWARNPYHTLYKTSQNLRKMPYSSYLESQVWMSDLAVLFVLVFLSVLMTMMGMTTVITITMTTKLEVDWFHITSNLLV